MSMRLEDSESSEPKESSKIQILDDEHTLLAVLPRRSTLAAVCVAVGDANHKIYEYAYVLDSDAVPLKSVHRLQKRLRSNVLLTNTAGLVPGSKSRRIGWCSYKTWLSQKTSRASTSSVVLEACVAPKVNKI